MILQFIINGLITGVLYSLLAIGFALVYNTTRIFHITAAALFVVAAYAFWFFAASLGINVVISALLAVVFTMGMSLLTEIAVYRPLKKKKASNNVAMIASIGMMTILVNLVAMFFGNETKVVDNSIQPTFSFGNIILTTPQLYQLVIGLVLLTAFVIFIRGKRGVVLQALSEDDVLFETLGYSQKKTRTAVFLISGVFIAAASCLTVYDVGMNPNMGMNILINAMVAMIIGGSGRFNACILGGLLLGMLQSLVVYQFASNWQNAITFIVLLLFLFLRPQGIAGYKQRVV